MRLGGGTGLTFLSAAAGEEEDHMADEQGRQLPQTPKFGAGSPTSLPTGLTLLCAPGEVQGLVSLVVPLLGDGAALLLS